MFSDNASTASEAETFDQVKAFVSSHLAREDMLSGFADRGQSTEGMDYLTDEELADHVAWSIVYGPIDV